MRTVPPSGPCLARAAVDVTVARRRLQLLFSVMAIGLASCAAPGPTPPPRLGATPGATPAALAATPAPTAAGPATRLAVLAGNPSDAWLYVGSGRGEMRSVPLPVAATAWISADAAGQLLATTAGGLLFVAGRFDDGGEPRWREIDPTYRGASPAAPLSFGTLSADGRTLAALAADFAAGTAFDLVVVDVGTGAASAVRVAAWPDGAAPAWLPDGRLLLIARDPRRDLTGLLLVDPARPARALRFEREAYGIALSADGLVVAIDRADGLVVAGATSLILDGGPGTDGDPSPAEDPSRAEPSPPDDPPGLLLAAPPGTAPGPFALDASGSRLAVTWLDDAGGPARVGRYRIGPDGPMAEAMFTIPNGAATAVVAWLP